MVIHRVPAVLQVQHILCHQYKTLIAFNVVYIYPIVREYAIYSIKIIKVIIMAQFFTELVITFGVVHSTRYIYIKIIFSVLFVALNEMSCKYCKIYYVCNK